MCSFFQRGVTEGGGGVAHGRWRLAVAGDGTPMPIFDNSWMLGDMRLVLLLVVSILAGCNGGQVASGSYGYYGGGYGGYDYNNRGYPPYFYQQNRQFEHEESRRQFQRRQLQQHQSQQLSQQRQLQQQQVQQQRAAPAARPPTPQEGQRLLDQLGIQPR
jgi:hypothetical protein